VVQGGSAASRGSADGGPVDVGAGQEVIERGAGVHREPCPLAVDVPGRADELDLGEQPEVAFPDGHVGGGFGGGPVPSGLGVGDGGRVDGSQVLAGVQLDTAELTGGADQAAGSGGTDPPGAGRYPARGRAS